MSLPTQLAFFNRCARCACFFLLGVIHKIFQAHLGDSYPSMPRLSWLVKLYGNLTYVRMRPADIALNYSVKDIRHDVRQIIGASLSEPHTSESNGGFFTYICIYIFICRTYSVNASWERLSSPRCMLRYVIFLIIHDGDGHKFGVA